MQHVLRNYERVPAEVVEGFRGLGVATVHEAQGGRGAVTAAIKAIAPGMSLLGTALTVKCPLGDNLMLHRALDLVQRGEVIVCDLEAWEGGPWGELMTVAAVARGCTGLLLDGYVRDGGVIARIGFSIFARGLAIRGATKERLGLVNHPIVCGGAEVRPGDLVLGDPDGACVVRREEAVEILVASRVRAAREAASRARLAAGASPWSLGGLREVADSLGSAEEEPAGPGSPA